MLQKWFAFLGLALATVPAGCGTVCNMCGRNPEPYGGVERDLTIAAENGGFFAGKYGKDDGAAGLLFLGIGATELACTVVGDTLTLPVVHVLQKRADDRDEESRRNLDDTNPE